MKVDDSQKNDRRLTFTGIDSTGGLPKELSIELVYTGAASATKAVVLDNYIIPGIVRAINGPGIPGAITPSPLPPVFNQELVEVLWGEGLSKMDAEICIAHLQSGDEVRIETGRQMLMGKLMMCSRDRSSKEAIVKIIMRAATEAQDQKHWEALQGAIVVGSVPIAMNINKFLQGLAAACITNGQTIILNIEGVGCLEVRKLPKNHEQVYQTEIDAKHWQTLCANTRGFGHYGNRDHKSIVLGEHNPAAVESLVEHLDEKAKHK